MSEQNKINVQPVVNTQSLQEQLNRQKYKINVDVDTSNLSNQLQSTVSRVTNNIEPTKIPLKIDTGNILKDISLFNESTLALGNIKTFGQNVSKSLD